MKLIAETRARPVKLVIDGDAVGEVSVDVSIWLDHHGWQSGRGKLDGTPSLIIKAFDAGHAEVCFEGERFGIVIEQIPPGEPARFVLSGDLPETLVGLWRPA